MDNVSEVKNKIDIVELIGNYVQLKKTGKNYKGLCPFHSEKTPSFIVSQDIQRFRCFGCGRTGDIFNFIQEYEGLEFPEALKMLADKAGVRIEYDKNQSKEKSESQQIIELNALSAQFFNRILMKHKFGKLARDYLEKRGLTDETANLFMLGYAPKSWDSLIRFIKSRKPEITDKILVNAGLARYSNKNTAYDMFRGRIMFPFIDPLDRVIGFSARAMNNEDLPKYINTAETLVFHKERFLFGLNLSKSEIRKKDEAIIVEGMMDMISLYTHGYKNVVSSNGTALTLGQLNVLKRYTANIVLIFDNDEAGTEAMIRGIKVIQSSGLNIRIGFLPDDSKDPDELMQKNSSQFKQIVLKAVPIWDFYFLYASKKYNLENVFERKSASDFLLSNIKQIDDEVIRSEYVKKFADLFELNEQNVILQMDKIKNDNLDSKDYTQNESGNLGEVLVLGSQQNSDFEVYPPVEVYVLSLLMKLESADISIYIDSMEEDYFSNENTRIIYVAIKEELKLKKTLDIKAFYDKLQSSQIEVNRLFEKIYLLGLDDSLDNSDVIHSELASAINRLKRSYFTKKLKTLAKAIKKAEAVSDTELSGKLQEEIRDYTEKLNELST